MEALPLAKAIKENLNGTADVSLWPEDVFRPSESTLVSLEQLVKRVQFGVFVFSPDDTVILRDVTSTTQRDNVLFEFGIFVGALGRQRAFIVLPEKSDQHLPTDLQGINLTHYDQERAKRERLAALGTACFQIEREIERFAKPLVAMEVHNFQLFLEGTSWLRENSRERVIFHESGFVSYVDLAKSAGWVERYSLSDKAGILFLYWRSEGRSFDARCEFNDSLTEFREVNSPDPGAVWRRMAPSRQTKCCAFMPNGTARSGAAAGAPLRRHRPRNAAGESLRARLHRTSRAIAARLGAAPRPSSHDNARSASAMPSRLS